MAPLQLAKCADKLSKLCISNSKVAITSVRYHWNKDFKPSPYPQTEAEKLAAAKRYNVHPAEYDVYEDNGVGYGDYPKLKLESGDSRDPHYPWDMPELKRNYNEPLHVEFDLIREDRYDVNYKPYPSGKVQALQFFGVMGGAWLLFQLFENVKCFHAVVPKQYPKDGPHYDFHKD